MRLDLPQVAVVGGQSSGKSSVLEALVGRDFLPRGNNIVTRRPLVLQLIKQNEPGGKAVEWGEFLHCRGKKFYDFERIRMEIETETDRSVGTEKGISSEPIRLRIFSPRVLTMTLVDLPGMTRVPVGDQPEDIERQLRKLILKYISSPTCIILAVSPANQDLASSDALDLAKKVDPTGIRTIGVLTKLDIMDRGTNAVAALQNEVVPLRLGYVGVVLRSQHDVVSGTSMARAREAEMSFFRSNSQYDAVSSRCGVGRLASKINEVLVDAIRETLPSLRASLESALVARRNESQMYGEAPPGSTGAARGALLLSILDSYSTRFAAVLDGKGEHLPVTEIAGGARIRHIFLKIFNALLDELNPAYELTADEIRTAIENSGGINGSLLIPEAPFEILVRKAIEKLLAPALQCKDFVHEELLKIALDCAPPEVKRFPRLQKYIGGAVEDYISAGAAPAERMIRNFVECELAFINTSNPAFIGGNQAIAHVLESKGKGSLSGLTTHPIDAQTKTKGPSKKRPSTKIRADGLAVAAILSSNLQEPELFRPDELMSARAPADASEGDPQPGKKWFNGWFGRSEEGQEASDSMLYTNRDECVLERPPQTLKIPENLTEQEAVQVEVTRVLIDSYFDIVRKNVQDFVPKIVMNFMVNQVKRGLQQHLTHVLYREDMLESIMKERDDVAERRKKCQDAMKLLRKAIKLLDTLPTELNVYGKVFETPRRPGSRSEEENLHAKNHYGSPLRSGIKTTRGHRGVLSPNQSPNLSK